MNRYFHFRIPVLRRVSLSRIFQLLYRKLYSGIVFFDQSHVTVKISNNPMLEVYLGG